MSLGPKYVRGRSGMLELGYTRGVLGFRLPVAGVMESALGRIRLYSQAFGFLLDWGKEGGE